MSRSSGPLFCLAARSNRHSGFTRLRMCDSWDSRFFDLGSKRWSSDMNCRIGNGSLLRIFYLEKRVIRDVAVQITGFSCTPSYGSYALGRTGTTYRHAMVSTSQFTSASRAGPKPVSGNGYSPRSSKIPTTNMSCWTPPWFAPISRQRPEKGGPKSGSGAFTRRIDDQNPHAGRCSRPSAAHHPNGR